MRYIPNRGDIVHLDFDPSSGSEMKGPHFGIVVSKMLFNKQGLAMICPISQGAANQARSHGFVVSLMGTGTQTQGNIHCHQLKSLDWRTRNIHFKEHAHEFIMDEVLARLESILLD